MRLPRSQVLFREIKEPGSKVVYAHPRDISGFTIAHVRISRFRETINLKTEDWKCKTCHCRKNARVWYPWYCPVVYFLIPPFVWRQNASDTSHFFSCPHGIFRVRKASLITCNCDRTQNRLNDLGYLGSLQKDSCELQSCPDCGLHVRSSKRWLCTEVATAHKARTELANRATFDHVNFLLFYQNQFALLRGGPTNEVWMARVEWIGPLGLGCLDAVPASNPLGPNKQSDMGRRGFHNFN